ncbi:hypothetical protein [Rhizomonospora bruguierae]|uniref:hypothetical protein n=1 Tax=Rhizomonospora bruguierae TaxID=1581705 RepID=UPI001BCFB1EF|nr:hypothetical protein [Micromonospora sp. NBRC 107566]
MTSAMRTSPGGAGRRHPVLRALLALALLVPTGVLFVQVWTSRSADLAYAAKERLGVEYLITLRRVATGLADNASAVVAGRTVGADALATAVADMGAVDRRIGGDLRATQRWAGLRTKIESLPVAADPAAGMAAYGEATDLLTALFEAVRTESGLVRDPDADAYFLQDAAAQELPEAVIAAGHLADVLTTAARARPADRAGWAGDETVARAAALSPVRDLADDVRSAVDESRSRTLGEALLSRVDRFRRAIDALTGMSAVKPDGPRLTTEQIGSARTEVQAAAADLAATMFTQLDGQLRDRADRLRAERLTAVGAMALAVLMAVTPALGVAVRAGRHRRRATRWAPDERGPTPPPAGGEQPEREWARAAR